MGVGDQRQIQALRGCVGFTTRQSHATRLEAVIGGREILILDMKWKVGASIKFFKDSWITISQSTGMVKSCLVKDFISPGQKWDGPRLVEAVGEEAVVTGRVPLLVSHVEDRPRFLGDDLNAFFVSKAYKRIMLPMVESDRVDWSWVWKLPCSQRIKL